MKGNLARIVEIYEERFGSKKWWIVILITCFKIEKSYVYIYIYIYIYI